MLRLMANYQTNYLLKEGEEVQFSLEKVMLIRTNKIKTFCMLF